MTGRESITCPACGMTSHNPNDVTQRYCGNCHGYIDDMLNAQAMIHLAARSSGGRKIIAETLRELGWTITPPEQAG
jgi:protein-arginine kinase activator protein McsA